jgi:hypothetical protein
LRKPPPEEISPGLFRVTWNPAPDVVRGFTPDGARILYQSRDLTGFGPGWYVLSVGITAGDVREEASVYRSRVRRWPTPHSARPGRATRPDAAREPVRSRRAA